MKSNLLIVKLYCSLFLRWPWLVSSFTYTPCWRSTSSASSMLKVRTGRNSTSVTTCSPYVKIKIWSTNMSIVMPVIEFLSSNLLLIFLLVLRVSSTLWSASRRRHRWRDRVSRRRWQTGVSNSFRSHFLLLHYCHPACHHSGYNQTQWAAQLGRIWDTDNSITIIITPYVLTGLIIDAFGELRDQIEQVRTDMESSCFICGIGKEYFDKSPHGFEKHVLNEHNFANYLCASKFTLKYTSNIHIVYTEQV